MNCHFGGGNSKNAVSSKGAVLGNERNISKVAILANDEIGNSLLIGSLRSKGFDICLIDVPIPRSYFQSFLMKLNGLVGHDFFQWSYFAQDELVVREDMSVFARYEPSMRHDYHVNAQIHVSSKCGRNSTDIDFMPMEGGNYFVREGISFVGVNDVVRFLSCDKWSDIIDVERSDTSEVLKGISRLSYGNRYIGQKLVVVGSQLSECVSYQPNCGSGSKKGCQPVYHIDLFFHPLGAIDTAQPKDFYYYQAVVVDSLLSHPSSDTFNWNRIRKLQSEIGDTFRNLESDLLRAGFVPCPVQIPLLAYFSSEESSGGPMGYVAFINGISSIGTTENIFYMPHYVNMKSDVRIKYGEALKIAIEQATVGGRVTVDTVSGIYQQSFALNCLVKVLERK